jgi:hypothetical protein
MSIRQERDVPDDNASFRAGESRLSWPCLLGLGGTGKLYPSILSIKATLSIEAHTFGHAVSCSLLPSWCSCQIYMIQ